MRKIFVFLLFIITCTVFADKITVDGIERTYILHIPESVSSPAPLVFVLHGGGGTGKRMNKLTKFNKVSNENGFIVCYPEGIDNSLYSIRFFAFLYT